jgi:hypothetical protein
MKLMSKKMENNFLFIFLRKIAQMMLKLKKKANDFINTIT